MQQVSMPVRKSDAAYTLDRNNAVPLYHQLFMDLRRRLLAGEWKPSDPFLKDSEIEQQYDVSRITARQAVAQLVDGNFVVRFRGRGSFVGNLPGEGARVNHKTVAEEIAAADGKPSHKNMGYEEHVVSDLTARQLQLQEGARVGILKRLHWKDDTPFCLESIMLSIESFPDFFENVLREEETLTAAYRRYGVEVVKCHQNVSAIMLSAERHRDLDLPMDAPALLVERIGYSASNRALDFRRLHYRADAFSLRQEIIWGGADNRIT